MTYVDGFVLPVPKSKLAAYRKMAKEGASLWKKNGALQYFECVGDDLNPKMPGAKLLTFPKMVKPKKGETVFFSFIVYKSKAHRNAVNKKVMKGIAEYEKEAKKKGKNPSMEMPFDMRRMAYGGFKAVVEK